jgi:hypothetical protein
MDIEVIRERILAGNYLIKSHAVQHALKEGFERTQIVEAIFNGKIIEAYPGDQRVLVCGSVAMTEDLSLYLHVVCEYADPVYVEIVTAYIPDDRWEHPPFQRRR